MQATQATNQEPSTYEHGLARVEGVLAMIPAEVVSRCAVECRSYCRALFSCEEHIREMNGKSVDTIPGAPLFERLQDIYTQIDEPDGIEGISSLLHVLDIDQQILGHRKAGRWTAAQSWYEIKLAENPGNVDVQLNLLTCLKESGQHGLFLSTPLHLQLWTMSLTLLKTSCSTT